MMLYIYYGNMNKESLVGVKKKILAQSRAFMKEFGKACYTIYAGQTIYLMQENTVIDKKYAATKKMCNEAVMHWLSIYGVKAVYIRYTFSDVWLIDLLKELKSKKIRMIMEFPTVPYDGEDGIIRPIEDKYYREQLHKYINCCTTYANYEAVFGIPCIPLVNGVNVDEHKLKKRNQEKEDITLLAVATMRREHGYERIIEGLYRYYHAGGNRKVYFRLAGDGPQIQYYKRLVKEYELEKYVTFYGFIQGNDLDKAYDDADIGIGALGLYKSGISAGVGIKAAEYCVRGLPMVMTDTYGFENKYYVYTVSNDSKPVNIDEMTAFYHGLQHRDYSLDMRRYIVEKYSWDEVLKPVIKYLREGDIS